MSVQGFTRGQGVWVGFLGISYLGLGGRSLAWSGNHGIKDKTAAICTCIYRVIALDSSESQIFLERLCFFEDTDPCTLIAWKLSKKAFTGGRSIHRCLAYHVFEFDSSSACTRTIVITVMIVRRGSFET